MSFDSIHKNIQERQPRLLEEALKESPKLVAKSDSDGRTPLMWALSETQDPELVSIVLKAARNCSTFSINHADGAGFTALHIAASLGAQFVEMILAFDPLIDAQTDNLQTPLFFAVSKKHIDAAKLLIDHNASVRKKDKRGVTILQRAVGGGSTELVELLLSKGAPVNATDNEGWTALHYAFAEARTDAIKILLDHGADPNLQSKEEELPKDVAPRGYEYKAPH